MAGLDLMQRGALYEAAGAEFVPFVERGLAYWGYYGGSIAETRRNLADPDAPDLAVVGSPTIEANAAVFRSGSNFLQTALYETVEMTIAAVVDFFDTGAAGSSRGVAISNYRSPAVADAGRTAAGAGFFQFNASGPKAVSGRWDGATSTEGNITAAMALTGGYKFLVERIKVSSNELLNLTTNVVLTASGLPARDVGSGALRIGSMIDATFTGQARLHFGGIWNVALTDEEIATFAAQVRKRGVRKGLAF